MDHLILCPYCEKAHDLNLDCRQESEAVEIPIADVDRDKDLKIMLLNEELMTSKSVIKRLRHQLNKKNKKARKKK